MMRITDWPLKERPRERLLQFGVHALSNAELLAIFLRTGIKGKTALDLSYQLLNIFGGFRDLLKASAQDFCKHPGLGQAKYAQLQAAVELTRRYIEEEEKDEQTFESSKQIKDFLFLQMKNHQREVFACLFLNTQHQLIAFEELFYGTLDSANIHPREIIKRALHLNAGAVVFAHNHPSGIAKPSLADKEMTRELISALTFVEIRVLDHMIIGKNEVFSFAEYGLIHSTHA